MAAGAGLPRCGSGARHLEHVSAPAPARVTSLHRWVRRSSGECRG
jgi:hypothetical protein